MEKLQLIDFSSEDDVLVSSPFTDSLEDFRLSDNFPVAMENTHELKSFKQLDIMDEKRLLSRSNGSGRATNSRDSLAWDSAFFTNAGVLDPDELFNMNKGFENPEVRKRKSTYSDYLFDTNCFFLESLPNSESDLFEDVTASIRKSTSKSNMNLEDHNQKGHISKKLDYVSQNRMKSVPSARKKSLYKQGLQVTEKSSASPFISQLHERNGKTKPFSPKPPKISGRVNLTPTGPTRNVPHSTDNAKIEHKSTTSSSDKGLLLHKKSRLGKSCCFTGSLSSPVTSSTLSPIASSDLISYCSPFGGASSLRSSSNCRAESKTRKSTLSCSVSTFRTPVRCSQDLENPNSSTQLSSFSNHSAYDLTPRTIDKCSLDLSSISCMSADCNTNPRDRNGNASAELGKGSKPSCLRMPSPKIGFFDKEPSDASFQFHIGSHSVSPHINGTATKKAWDSSPVSPRARRLSPCQYTQRKPVTDHKSPKPPLEPKKGIFPLLVRESNSKARKVGDRTQVERKPSPHSTVSIVNKRTKAVLGNKIGREGKVYDQALQESSPLLVEENVKEKLLGSGDDVEGLTKYFADINLKSRETMELAQNGLSKPRARLPLADKNCVPNGSDDLLMIQNKVMKTRFAVETIENYRSKYSRNA